MAKIIGISYQHLRNVLTPLFERLDVDNTMQAQIFVENHRVDVKSDNQTKMTKQPSKIKQPQRKMTPDKLLLIQEALHKGKSVNSIAKREGISERTIRYHIIAGNLKKRL